MANLVNQPGSLEVGLVPVTPSASTFTVDLELEPAVISEVDNLSSSATRLIIGHRESPMSNADVLLTIIDEQLVLHSPGESA